MNQPSLELSTGNSMPQVGLGFWKVDQPEAARLLETAVEIGYRHFDCACDYGNEAEVGQGLSHVLGSGQVQRDDLWITSKLWNTFHRPEHVRMACEKTLSDLQLDHLDLYLMHFPIAQKFVPIETRYPPGWFFDPEATDPCMEEDDTPLLETWQAMEELVEAGLVKQIGLCNMGTALIREFLKSARIKPSVLQIELHPMLAQEKLLRFCREAGIAVTGFSPFGGESYISIGMATQNERLLGHSTIQEIASAHGKSDAQILLRWAVQRGTSVVPKSSNPVHLRENLDLFCFQLTEEEMARITALDQNRRFNDPGEFCEKAFNTFFPIYE